MKSTDELMEKFAVHVTRESERWRDEMRAGMSQFASARRLQGSRALAVPLSPGTKLLWGGPGRLLGWTLRNAASSGNINVNLYDGRDNGTDLIGTASIGSGSSWQQSSVWMAPSGISFTEALYFESLIGSGSPTLAGAIYIGAVD